jgi:tRNA pseudouridine38-40 synthase
LVEILKEKGSHQRLPFFIGKGMVDRKNIKMILQYDGTQYHGWQWQKNALTIQAVVQEKIQVLTREHVTVIASGRTDAGVHALHQVCHFLTHSDIDPESIRKGLNSLLPGDIFVRHAERVPLDFHARYSVKSKTYEYRILNRQQPDLFLRHYAWHITRKLDFPGMEACLSLLKGRHDFSSFRSSGSENLNSVREMIRSELHGSFDEGLIHFIFEADGFLRHMVRNIVGTVIEVGSGRTTPDGFLQILEAKDRKRAGIKAPPQGLFLTMVRYED